MGEATWSKPAFAKWRFSPDTIHQVAIAVEILLLLSLNAKVAVEMPQIASSRSNV